MRILFVDDEELVLQAIERSLFHVDGWEIESATSGAEALEILGEEHFDVVVSDMRMPGMDGAEFLTRVHDEYPDTVRMVLSGHAEQEAAMRTIGVAHQFLAKPCGAGTLQAAIERTIELQHLLGSPSVQELVGRVPTLPSAPQVYHELTRLMAVEDVDLRAVTAVVEADPALCAKLLQVVNSAFFAQSQPTAEVHQAVVKLGLTTLKGLVVSLEAMSKFDTGKQVVGFSFGQERAHSHDVALLTSSLYQSKKVKADAFMAATLHDIGKWVLAAEAPETLEAAISLSTAQQVPMFEAERQLYGATHAEVGAYLLGLWCLPESVVGAVANHHIPDRVPPRSEPPLEIAHAVHIADSLIRGTLTEEELSHLGCALRLDELEQRRTQLQRDVS